MTGDLWDQPEARRWRDRANRELRPMIDQSAASLTLWPTDGQPDAKIAVELGFTLLLGKPLIVLKPSGENIPARLARFVDAVIEYDDVGQLSDPVFSARIRDEVDRVLAGNES